LRPQHQFQAAFEQVERLIGPLRSDWPAISHSMRNATRGCSAGAFAERINGGRAVSDPTMMAGIAGIVDQAAADIAKVDEALPQLVALALFLDQMRRRYGTATAAADGYAPLGLCRNEFGCPKGAEALRGRRDRYAACYAFVVRHGPTVAWNR
jgi:hypothetical protein